MSKSYFTKCPRCGTRSYEKLPTHGHCIECLYSNDLAPERGRREFLTLREAEELIAPADLRQMQDDQKKISGAAS